MKRHSLFLITAVFLQLLITPLALAQTSTVIDLKIDQFAVTESIGSDGTPRLFVFATFSNSQSTAAENCAVDLKVNDQSQTPETFTKIEKGPKYLFTALYSGALSTYSGSSTTTVKVELQVCPDIAGEKSKNNNSRSQQVRVSAKKAVTVGTKVDLSLRSLQTMTARDKTNTLKYWYALSINNNGQNVAEAFSNKLTVNGINPHLIAAQALPGKSTAIYQGFYDAQPFLEGKNLVTVVIDYDQKTKETNEKNTYNYEVKQSDGLIKTAAKNSSQQKMLVQGLIIVNQMITPTPSLPQSDTGLLLAIPIINTAADITGSQSAPMTLKIDLKYGNTIASQNFPITEWKAGTLQNFFFTNKYFTKSQLSKNFTVTVSLNDQKLFSGNLKPAAFY